FGAVQALRRARDAADAGLGLGVADAPLGGAVEEVAAVVDGRPALPPELLAAARRGALGGDGDVALKRGDHAADLATRAAAAVDFVRGLGAAAIEHDAAL